jgi:hypothetical protein
VEFIKFEKVPESGDPQESVTFSSSQNSTLKNLAAHFPAQVLLHRSSWLQTICIPFDELKGTVSQDLDRLLVAWIDRALSRNKPLIDF